MKSYIDIFDPIDSLDPIDSFDLMETKEEMNSLRSTSVSKKRNDVKDGVGKS